MLRMLSCYHVTPWIGLSHYYIVVDDMIIIMLTIPMKDGRCRLPRPGALFHSSHLGPEFRVLCLLTSVPNRVWDAMGSPLLTYLASNISSGGPSRFTICKPCIYVSVSSRQIRFKPMRASGEMVPCWSNLTG